MQKPKGTYDIFGDKSLEFLYLRKLVTSMMEKYNYNYIETPIFESSDLFHRGVGETTDIVSKETYDFKDRGNRNLTLRPEGTAGVVRCFIENKFYADTLPYKCWYMGPMFRYERPQAGRFREFYQFGVESFGSSDAMMDAEVISIAYNLFKLLGLKDVKVRINSLGDRESRESYRSALVDYFKPYVSDLCEDCKRRFETNPLRILDCKVDADNDIMKNAPKMIDYLNDSSKKHFADVKLYLESMGIEYIVDSNIVRGLDYYTHTVFEVSVNVKELGSQNVLAGGGRYDNLVESLDGPLVPGVGFAVGLERLFFALDKENINIRERYNLDAYVVSMNDECKKVSLFIANKLRLNGFNVELDFNERNLKSNFRNADKLGTSYIIIVGEDEVKSKVLTIKDNNTKEEFKISFDELISFFDEKLGDVYED